MISTASVTIFERLDDPRLTSCWRSLLDQSPTREVFLTQAYQHAWWDSFGRGRLLPIAVEDDSGPAMLAPLFADQGMVYFVGSGGSDYLDFLGEPNAEAVASILAAAAAAVDGFLGCLFYHVPDASPTGGLLRRAAELLGWDCYEEGGLPAPRVPTEDFQAAAKKKSLLRRERWFGNHGDLRVESLRDADSILPHLEEFFEQHERRWAATDSPSLFHDDRERRFYRRLVERLSPEGTLRFTRLEWDGRPIAFHLGFSFAGSYLWYKPSFEIELAKRSPGEALLRTLLLEAEAEDAATFDFGLGDEPFKRRFATEVRTVRNWGLYPTAHGGRP